MRTFLLVVGALGLWITPLYAADVGVGGKKLIIQDKLLISSRARVVFVSTYNSPVTKGTGTDPGDIDAQFDVSYVDDPASGSLVIPAGANWLVNNARIAKYVNKEAPLGSGTKIAIIKPDGKLKLSAKSLGDTPIDILGAGSPGPGGVLTVFTVTNGAETNRHCTLFTSCIYKSLFGGMGAQLTCRNGTAAGCP